MDDPDVRPLFPRRLRRGELIALDAAAGAGYAFVLFLGSFAYASPIPLWARCLVAAVIGLPVGVRRLWPGPVFCVTLAGSVAGLLLGVVREPFAAAAYALYLVAVTTRRRRWEPTLAIAAFTILLALLAVTAGPAPNLETGALWGWGALGCVVMGGAWTIGRAVRERRGYAARAAEQLAGRAVAEERLRIARELHDVVSHTLSVIGVKAAIANHVADERPAEVRDALRVIEVTSREALAEMRHMLGVLRSGETPADLGPLPGLAALPELAGRAAMAGVRVALEVRVPGRLPEGVELSAYRIVQEAVTNVVKHAAPARCRVAIEEAAGELRIEVTDDGPGERVLPSGPGRALRQGHGIIGMRERALMYGGAFEAGPRPGGGFGVLARLPLDVAIRGLNERLDEKRGDELGDE
ncbi:sensor histidine kinase [Sphaerimonospora thailandensis]|uniref:sensor histidine kinase n=1 Tax=Sphaerimonospora thailandensis TaxID=795644 RepID=UPI001950E4D0|nr:sensor histidine kinase [Sphaerimonospora thailandensis]